MIPPYKTFPTVVRSGSLDSMSVVSLSEELRPVNISGGLRLYDLEVVVHNVTDIFSR